MTILICDCNQTMPLQPAELGAALHEELTLYSALCRRQSASFQQAVLTGEDLVVACTQEKRLFSELAAQTQGSRPVAEQAIRFVNIRETGGWSKDAARAMPKVAALLAVAQLPEPEPVPTVTFSSAGRLLIIGPLDEAERMAGLLDDALEVTLFVQGPGAAGGMQERRYPVLAGRIEALSGWLGAFELRWSRDNPINLDLCTRCNACLVACPEGAIGLDYQVDSALCKAHRSCVKVCTVAGAIDFAREPQQQSEKFDMVLDLRSPGQQAPAASHFAQHAPPQGYFRLPSPAADSLSSPTETQTLLRLRGLVGEFENPRFFVYKQKLCAHSRNMQTGCDACIRVCSTAAISSEPARQQIKVNPNLCVGCGACTTVCPSGALVFAYPSASEQGVRLKTLLATYTRAGGRDAAVLLHSAQDGARLVEDFGRAARTDAAVQGIPARVLPFALWHTASTGLDVWLTAIAYGASQVWVLMTDEEAPQYRDAVRAQMAVAQAVLHGLGYTGTHFAVLEAGQPRDFPGLDKLLRMPPARGVARPAGFAVQADKRATVELALAQLVAQAPAPVDEIALGAGAPFGSLEIDKDACTLCLSCVSACPTQALQDNPLMPQLGFIEKNCVQCGLCVTTCPEDALRLQPRLLLAPERNQARVLHASPPYACIRCNKPFGTLKAIESMLGKLAGHAMFQGEALQRLRMCGDCRVIDLYSASNEIRITDL